MTMYALTLWQPWAELVVSGEKLIENRPWMPPAFVGDGFLIHAGKKWDKDGLGMIEEMRGSPPPPRNDCSFGSVIGFARCSVIVTSEDAAESAAPGHGKWFMGPYGWVLHDVQRIAPIPCRGYQKFWRVPEDVNDAAQFRLEWDVTHAP